MGLAHHMAHGVVAARGAPEELALHRLKLAAAPAQSAPAAEEATAEGKSCDGDSATASAADVTGGIRETDKHPLWKQKSRDIRKEATAEARSPAPAAPSATATPAPANGGGVGEAGEMGRGNSRFEAARFYAAQLGALGICCIGVTFVGLACCRALADWSLGRWIDGMGDGGGDGSDGNGQSSSEGGVILYAGLTAGTVCLGCLYALSFTRVIGTASRIHAAVLSRVLRAPKAFFDTTPLGLLVNVFSKDMDTLDELLCAARRQTPSLGAHFQRAPCTLTPALHGHYARIPRRPIALTGFLKCLTIVSTALVVAAVAAPASLVIVPPVAFVFRRLAEYFQRTASQLKRIEKASAGPLFSLYTETLQGMSAHQTALNITCHLPSLACIPVRRRRLGACVRPTASL